MSTANLTIGRERPVLGCYLPAGDPALPGEMVQLYRNCGVDLLEFGLPCEDPFLDGPVIKQAMARAIAAGLTEEAVRKELEEVRSIFAHGSIVVVSYGNFELTRLRNGAGQWLFDVSLNLSDLATTQSANRHSTTGSATPPAAGFVSYNCRDHELIRARDASLYVMLQATPGRTGGTAKLGSEVVASIHRLKSCGISVPILLGIGISTPELAAQAIKLGADGVVVGSRCVTEALRGSEALRAFVGAVREAIDGAD